MKPGDVKLVFEFYFYFREQQRGRFISFPLSPYYLLLLLTVVGRVDHGRVEDAVDVEHARGLFLSVSFFCFPGGSFERRRRGEREEKGGSELF